VFVFPGQGCQWPGMGQRLSRSEPAFREALVECDAALQPHVRWSLLHLVETGDPALLDDVAVAQPVLFGVEVALAALWRSWGVRPDAVLGHSVGEAAAAYVAGALNLQEAAHAVVAYSRALKAASGTGGLAVSELSPEQATRIAQAYPGRLFYAGSNGPGTTILSGETAALNEIGAAMERKKLFFGRVLLDAAVHSPLVQDVAAAVEDELRSLHPRPAAIPLYSSVTGERQAGGDFGPAYWVRNLREPIRFGEAIQVLLRGGPALFVEVGPHPVLAPSVEAAIRRYAPDQAEAFLTLVSCRRGMDEQLVMRSALQMLQARSVAVDRLYN
jgi:acyl transferase domain-containing protein